MEIQQPLRSIFCLFIQASCLLALSLAPTPGQAQGQRYIFERINQLATIPDVYSLDTDEYGRLWYSSWGRGVFCFDGYNHTRYITNSNDSNSIINDRVYDLQVDRQQRVWVGTLKGLSCIDRKSGLVRRFTNVFDSIYQFQAIYEDKAGKIWFGTPDLLMYFDEVTQRIVAAPSTSDLRNTRCRGFLEAADGTLWACRTTGLFRFSSDRRSYEKVALDYPEHRQLNFRTIFEDSNGNFILGTDQGLWLYDRISGEITRPPLPDSITSPTVLALTESPKGVLWVSLMRHGLLRWNVQSGDFMLFKNKALDPASLPNNSVTSLKADQFGNLWVGTEFEVARLNLSAQPFSLWPLNGEDPKSKQNSIVRIAEDTSGAILVRAENQLYYLKALGATPMPIRISQKSRAPQNFYTGQDGKVWVIADQLYQWNADTRTFTPFKTPLLPYEIYNIAIDAADENIIWMATWRGLQRFDCRTGEAELFNKLLPAKEEQYITNLVDNGRGALWLVLPRFLGKFDKKSRTIDLYSVDTPLPHRLVNSEILDIQMAPDGWVWVTTSGGITRIDPRTGAFHNLTCEEGLADNVNPTVLFDKKNNAWIVSPEQIVRRDAHSGNFRTFDISATLQTYLWTRGRCELRDGRLLFAGARGLLMLDPKNVMEDQAVATILLTRFETSDKEKSRKFIPEFLEHVQLSYAENDISIEWAAIQTARSKDLQYECKLEPKGEQAPWVQKGKGLQALYGNLAPGAYIFKVRVVGSDKPELTLSIAIAAPWWRSDWFKMLIAALAISLTYLVWLSLEKQRQLRQQKELAEKNAHYKTRFLANMSHEIRTPMNAILGLSRLLTESTLPPKQATYSDAIRQSSENLLVIVNDVLDQAKIESGKFKFQHKPFDLQHIIQHLQNTLGFKAEEKKLDFQITIKEGTATKLIGDPVRLSQILTNLLGNALKFTENGYVRLTVGSNPPTEGGKNASLEQYKVSTASLGSSDGQLQHVEGAEILYFQISDTGIGIAEDQLKKVFESFQQADDEISSNFGGTGLGLSITKQLVEQQNGTISLESILGKGTTITVAMPFNINKSASASENTSVVDVDTLNNLKILLVEDTFFNQMLAIELLKSRIPDVVIEVAENGQVALEKLESNGVFDLVLMDVKMPVMNGLEATRRIRAQAKWAELPVIALTANAVPEELEKCKEAGMNDWVTKPIDTEDLFFTINTVLNKFTA